MRYASFINFAGLSAILAAILFVGSRIILRPYIDAASSDIEDLALAHVAVFEAGSGWASRLSHLAFGLAHVFLVGPALVIAQTMVHSDRGWVLWISGLGIAGFILNGYRHVYAAVQEHVLVDNYLQADETVRAAVVANWPHVDPDPGGLIHGTLLVIWLAGVNTLAWRNGYWARWLAILGLTVAALIVLREVTGGLIPALLVQETLLPLWYALMGLALLRVLGNFRWGHPAQSNPTAQ